MKGFVPPDPMGGVSKVQFAVVYAPRAKRHRFSANCVQLYNSETEAVSRACIEENKYPAKVLGPSKSSEGLFVFYLIEWLSI
jgi:hypothetical protein